MNQFIACTLFFYIFFQVAKSNDLSGRLKQKHSAPHLAADKCVFILATGSSGSTALMDALNQIPNYLIRGESWGAHFDLHNAYQRLSAVQKAPGQEYFDWREQRHASLHMVKSTYEAQASRQKLPFFNEFHTGRVITATRVYYNVLYGHFGAGVVSGFKESRYVCGQRFQSLKCYEEFMGFMRFLRKLCLRVKVLLLTRSDHSTHANPELFEHVSYGLRTKAEFDLRRTHEVYDEYALSFPKHALRVHTQDMFDPQRNATFARNLLSFLQEDPSLPIGFSRMPARE